MAFVTRIHLESQQHFPQRTVSGYPPMVVVYFRNPPILTDAQGQRVEPVQVNPAFLDAAATLGRQVDFLVITANGAHSFQAEIQKAAGRPLLSMVDLTLHAVNRAGWRRVGVLGLGLPDVYTQRMAKMSLAFETVPARIREPLDGAIFAYMEGKDTPEMHQAAVDAIEVLRNKGVDGIILGCTEIPLILKNQAQAADLIDPSDLLASAAVQFAAGPERPEEQIIGLIS